MRKGAKRKTAKHTEEPKPDVEEAPTVTASQENEIQPTKAPSRAKRQKTSKPQSEPEYFEDKRNLVSINMIRSSCLNLNMNYVDFS